MTDFLDLCKKRQSCRKFAPKPVEHEKLVKCVEAARLTPSGCNSQPWSFIVVESAPLAAEVLKCGQPDGSNPYLDGARAVILVLEEYAQLMPRLRGSLDSQYFAKSDIGAAMLSICLEAEEQGLGSLIVGLFDRPKIRELLGLGEEVRIAGYIAIGYSDDPLREKARKPYESLVRFV
jgi:nitroreductase